MSIVPVVISLINSTGATAGADGYQHHPPYIPIGPTSLGGLGMLDLRKLANIQVLLRLSLRLFLRVETDEEPGYEWTILTELVARKSMPVGPPPDG